MDKLFEADSISRVAECTIKGCDLNPEDYKRLMEHIGEIGETSTNHSERLLFLYRVNDNFEKSNLSLGKHSEVLVGITDSRIFKVEKSNVWCQPLEDIVSVRHIKNNVFSWDKIECKTSSGNVETFGISHKSTCGFFVHKLNEMIKSKDELKEIAKLKTERRETLNNLIKTHDDNKTKLETMTQEADEHINKLYVVIQRCQEELSTELLNKHSLQSQINDHVSEIDRLKSELTKLDA